MKTKARKVGLLFLSLFLAVAILGCPVPVDEFGGLTAAEVVERTIEALQAVETAQFEMEQTIHTEGEMAGEAIDELTISTSIGAIDMINHRMKKTTTTVTQFPMPREMVVKVYVLGGMLYMKTSLPGMSAHWIKDEIPWGEVVPIEGLIEQLTISAVELAGTEEVREIHCLVISMVPDMEMP